MWRLSRRAEKSLDVALWVPRVEWSSDGRQWSAATYIDGDVTASATSQVRWSCTLTIAAEAPGGTSGITPYGTLVRVWTGIVLDGSPEWVPLGEYRVVTLSRDRAAGTLTVTCESLESRVIDDRFLVPRTYPAGRSAVALIRELILESVPTAQVSVAGDVEDVAAARIVEERDRWAVIDGRNDAPSLARALGAVVHCTRSGAFIISPPGALTDDPVWTVDEGDGGLLITAGEELSRDGVFNVVVARGATDETDDEGNPIPPVGPAIAADTDPTSPTFVDGPFGRVPRFYTSPHLKQLWQCNRAAQRMLGQQLGLRKTLSFTAAAHPGLDVSDTVTVRTSSGDLERHVVDSITYPLAGGQMQVSTRATSTRLAGELVLAPEQAGDEEETDSDV